MKVLLHQQPYKEILWSLGLEKLFSLRWSSSSWFLLDLICLWIAILEVVLSNPTWNMIISSKPCFVIIKIKINQTLVLQYAYHINNYFNKKKLILTSMWVFISKYFLLWLICYEYNASTQSIGFCYGTLGDNLPSAPEVVQLYQRPGIEKMLTFLSKSCNLEALRGSSIRLILGVPNEDLQGLASIPKAVIDWIQSNDLTYASTM